MLSSQNYSATLLETATTAIKVSDTNKFRGDGFKSTWNCILNKNILSEVIFGLPYY